jgi:hypothetical protein
MLDLKIFLKDRWTYSAYALTATYLLVAPKNFLPLCPIHFLFGLYCPACGSTRALRELFAGHIGISIRDNALLLFSPLLIGLGIKLKTGVLSKNYYIFYLIIVTIIILVFTVLRNSPGSFFTPLPSLT